MSQASLSDILTAIKNLVTAINTLTQTFTNIEGAQTLESISAATLVKNSSGRLVQVSVTTAGSAVGHIYDSNSLSSVTKPLYVIPNTVGVYVMKMPVNYGILVVPGSFQVVAVSFS